MIKKGLYFSFRRKELPLQSFDSKLTTSRLSVRSNDDCTRAVFGSWGSSHILVQVKKKKKLGWQISQSSPTPKGSDPPPPPHTHTQVGRRLCEHLKAIVKGVGTGEKLEGKESGCGGVLGITSPPRSSYRYYTPSPTSRPVGMWLCPPCPTTIP